MTSFHCDILVTSLQLRHRKKTSSKITSQNFSILGSSQLKFLDTPTAAVMILLQWNKQTYNNLKVSETFKLHTKPR